MGEALRDFFGRPLCPERDFELVGPIRRCFELPDGALVDAIACDYSVVYAEPSLGAVQLVLGCGDGGLFISADRAATRRLIHNLELAMDKLPLSMDGVDRR